MARRALILCAGLLAAISVFSGCNASADWVKNTIQSNYYRFDGNYSDLEDLNGLSISQMMEKLDIYSAYYTAEEYKKVEADNRGNKTGIGVSTSFSDGVGVVVTSVVGNSPAKRAGIKAGDIIVSGEATGEKRVFTSSADFTSFVNDRKTYETFKLKLSDGREISLSREDYKASYVLLSTSSKTYDIRYENNQRTIEEINEGIAELPQNCGYIRLNQFYGDAGEEMGKLLEKFTAEGCTSLVLDLRGNGGGYVSVLREIGGRFTSSLGSEKYISLVAKYKNGREVTDYCQRYGDGLLPAGTDVYVLANSSTASASEALIGILVSYNILSLENIFLSQYKGAEPRSYGKGIMQSPFTNFTSGEVLKLTVAGIYWANGVSIHGTGLTPQMGCSVAPASDNIVDIGYDDELQPVIDKINSQNQ